MKSIPRFFLLSFLAPMVAMVLSAMAPLAAYAHCPAPRVKWLSTDYDFGTFNEADGEVTGQVSFVNEGDAPTFISRVRPSCGCTGASYPKSMIAPGDTATIKFTYNPAGRPGKFDKTVKVWLDADNALTTIHIRGTVIGERQTMEWYYPVEAGPLRMEKDTLDVGEIKRGDVRHLYLTLCNQTSDSITPAWECSSASLKIDLASDTIAPGDLGVMSFYWRSGSESLNGPVEHTVFLIPDSRNPELKKKITLLATIMPDVPLLTPELLAKAPLAEISERMVELGKIKDAKIPFEFHLINRGEGVLNVDRVYTHGGSAVTILKSPKKIKPGKSASVKGRLDATRQPVGPFRILVEVLTDDPVHPTVSINLTGEKTE